MVFKASRRASLGALAGLGLAAAQRPATAQQAWPTKPIRLVLPSGAGGGADIFGRPLAEFMGRELKTTVVVENRPGATGLVAHEAVVKQPPDGYTLLISFTAAIIGNKLLQPKLSHDPLNDFTPIARIGGGGGNMLIVHPDVPARNLKELSDWIRSRNTEVNYASWGIASGGHLLGEMMRHKLNLRLNHVPYKTVSQIPVDVISGTIQVAWIDSATPVPHIKSGKVRPVAVAAAGRLPQTPDVQTLNEQGLPNEAEASYSMLGPLGMQADVVNKINAVVNRWLKLPETITFFEQNQNAPAPKVTTPAELAAILQRDLVAWRKLIADSKVVL